MKLLIPFFLLLLPLVAATQSQPPPCPSSGYKHNCFGAVSFENARYEGEFQNDKPHGRGTGSFNTGARYVGEHKDGKHHGQGTYSFPSGARYVGDHRDGKRHGHGTYTFPNGESYIGDFRDNERHGRGTYTFISGAKYVGEWRDSQRNGHGIEYRADGTVARSGQWADGQLVQTFVLDRSRFPFDGPSHTVTPSTNTDSAERGSLAAEAESARRRQRELEALLEAEKKRRVEAENRGRGQVSSTGTGFSVAPGIVVTNQHVVAGCRNLEVISTDGRRSARVVDADELVDLALLRVTGLRGSVASIRKVGSVRLGEQAYAFGFPLTGLLSESGNFTGGSVSSLRGMRDSASQIQISTPVQPGNSGGALADSSGSVIGVVVGKLNASVIARATGDIPQNVNFAVSLQALSDFLRKNNINVRTVDRNTALDTTQLADLIRGFTHRIECLDQSEPAVRPSPGGAMTGQAANDTTVVLKNRSLETILNVFVSPQNATTWGSELLGERVLDAGESFTLKPHAAQGCIYKVRVMYAGGRQEQKNDQNFCALDELVFSGESRQGAVRSGSNSEINDSLISMCNVTAAEINRSLPQIIDRVTTLTNATCYQVGRTVRLQYRNLVSTPADSLRQAGLVTLRPRIVASFCTDPGLRVLINQVDIQYHYSDSGGKYIGVIDVSEKDCR